MREIQNAIAFVMAMSSVIFCHAQGNVGIGTTTPPSEKLEVAGVIYTSQGGIRFPDQTLQETAAMNYDPPAAAMPNGPVFMQLSVLAPTDTIWLLDISTGGADRDVMPGGGGGGYSVSNISPVRYRVLKQVDATSVNFLELVTDNTFFPWVRFSFTNAEGDVYLEVELRDAIVTKDYHRNTFLGNGQFAHLEDLEFYYKAIEIKQIVPGPDPCYCWSFETNNTCICN